MTVPRREIVDEKVVGVYHCISRCVRRAYLCGYDTVQGKSFEHRKEWVRERLSFLIEVFAIELLSYVLMSNHIHTLVRLRPDVAALWSAEEVARRWRTLFPRRRVGGRASEPSEEEISAIAGDPELVELYRKRLGSLSWLQGCLCGHLAKRANREDECTGRFWEGRFKSQRVHEVSGVIACMAYIDLNPIRAGVATTVEGSEFTSIQDRLKGKGKKNSTPRLATVEECTAGRLRESEYVGIVQETARVMAERGAKVGPTVCSLLERLQIRSDSWLDTTTNLRPNFKRAVGPVEALTSLAARAGKQWLHGLAAARRVFN